jgi:hypothetical protein
MIRLAALLLLVSQLILLLLVYQPSGSTAILFSFVGTPLLGLGLILLALAAFRERKRRSPNAG